jgi:hypothetical protein
LWNCGLGNPPAAGGPLWPSRGVGRGPQAGWPCGLGRGRPRPSRGVGTPSPIRCQNHCTPSFSLAVVSNAGYECVCAADRVEDGVLADGSPRPPLRLATFLPATRGRLASILAGSRIDRIIDVHNPLDLTPMAGADVWVGVVEALLEDEGVDGLIVSPLPMTPQLHTLPPSADHDEDLHAADQLPALLGPVVRAAGKPVVFNVDCGSRYDSFARALRDGCGVGVPTPLEGRGGPLPVFRSMDRLMDALRAVATAATMPL